MQIKTAISSIQSISPSVKLITLDPGEAKFEHYAGQWIDIHLTIEDETHNCGYSIVSIPDDESTIDIAVKLAPDLPLTVFLHQRAKPGDIVYISRARGDVCLDKPPQGNYVFIAGGVGITPLISMIHQINRIAPQCKMTLLYSITHPVEFLFKDRIVELANQNVNFQYFTTVTRTPEHSEAYSGRINRKMLDEIPFPQNARYYLCGPPQMVDDISAILNGINIPTEKILFDRWWA